jgi:hypothetical protein
MKKVTTLKSGHVLTVNVASLAAASELKSVIANELQRRVTLNGMSDGVVFALLAGNRKGVLGAIAGSDVNVLWQIVLTLLGSREIEAAFFECAKVCTLNTVGPDVKIDRTTFEPEEVRRDMIPVALEVMKENLSPFFEDLLSQSPIPGAETAASPK